MSKANTRVVDLNENLDPTGAENLYLATETTDEKISLNGVKKFLEKNFLKKSENLADINAAEWRKNLGVYSQDEADEKNAEKANKQHTHEVAEITDFDEKVTKKIQSNIIAGENIFIEIENEKVKITSSGWSGGTGRGGDMLKSIYDKDNDGIIDKAKTAEIAEKSKTAENTHNLGGKNLKTIENEAENKFITKINRLPKKADLNDILDVWIYYNPASSDVKEFKNAPTKRAGTLLVYLASGCIQEWIDYDLRSRWIRRYYTHTTGNWTEWREIPLFKEQFIESSEKGQVNGVATLNANGAIDSRQIPPYLENPLVYINRSEFPAKGQLGKLYMDEQTGNLYVWQNNKYCEYFSIQTERQKNQINQNIRTKIWLYS